MRIAVLVLVIVGGACAGYWMQREVPSEKNRVRHPQAYSVCRPEGWSADMDYVPDTEQLGNAQRLDGILLSPDEFTGRRPKLFVNRFASAPDAEYMRTKGWTDGTFQGQPALVLEKKLIKALTRGAMFERAGQWFEVLEGLPVPAAGEEDQWWAFLETFKYPDGVPATINVGRAMAVSAPATTKPFEFPAMGQ
jgi:hypothetical protein